MLTQWLSEKQLGTLDTASFMPVGGSIFFTTQSTTHSPRRKKLLTWMRLSQRFS
jgi:hypothetical protein